MPTLEAVKAYMKAEDEEDFLVQELMDAAAEYLAASGVHETEDNAGRYDLAVKGLCLHWYDNRGSVLTGTMVTDIPLGLRAVINQLKSAGTGLF